MKKIFIVLSCLLTAGCLMERAADKYPSDLTEADMQQIKANIPDIESGKSQLCILNPIMKITDNDSPCLENYSDASSYNIWAENILLDGVNVTRLQAGEYFCKNIENGEHVLNSEKENRTWKIKMDSSYKFDIKPNEILFLEYFYDEYIPLQSKNLNHIIKERCVVEIEEKVHCEEDEYDKSKFCFSPTYKYEDSQYGKTSSYFGVNANSAYADPYIVVTYSASDWAFIKSATDSEGNVLPMKEIRTNINQGIYETYRIDITMAYIKKHKNKGINIKLYGRNRNSYIKLPPEYVQGWLNYLKKNKLLN